MLRISSCRTEDSPHCKCSLDSLGLYRFVVIAALDFANGTDLRLSPIALKESMKTYKFLFGNP